MTDYDTLLRRRPSVDKHDKKLHLEDHPSELNNSMEPSHSWEAISFSVTEEITTF
jgi:hypothetical protein